MAFKEEVFSSKAKYDGIFSFKDFYKFCFDWLTDETGLTVAETKYQEKIAGDSKSIDITWEPFLKFNDYFKFTSKIEFQVIGLTNVEMNQGGVKIKTNKGSVKVTAKGYLVRDYDGKFGGSAFKKFVRGIYEKWVIQSRIESLKDKIAADLDEFLCQAKAYLDLEGKR